MSYDEVVNNEDDSLSDLFNVDQEGMLSFITQVFDAMIGDIAPPEVQDCLKRIKQSYEALLQVVVYNFA